jgi:hypothetical protein
MAEWLTQTQSALHKRKLALVGILRSKDSRCNKHNNTGLNLTTLIGKITSLDFQGGQMISTVPRALFGGTQ